MVDMAHIAGLIAAGQHQNPLPYAHVVTSTTHKTLRGPRGGLILCNDEEIAKAIDKNVFPGTQGGPLMHIIAAKAVSFNEALDPSFKEYGKQVILNAQALSKRLTNLGYRIISGGTDNHIVLVDTYGPKGITGKEAETVLGSVNITINKNQIPFDTLKPMVTSGIRLGSAAMTTKGFKEAQMIEVANLINETLENKDNLDKLQQIKERVIQLVKNYQIY